MGGFNGVDRDGREKVNSNALDCVRGQMTHGIFGEHFGPESVFASIQSHARLADVMHAYNVYLKDLDSNCAFTWKPESLAFTVTRQQQRYKPSSRQK